MLLKETSMGQAIHPSAATLSLGSRCYRLTGAGRACVDLVETEQQTLGSLSRHLHDVLMMCGTGMWFEQLQQFMPPRSLDESLRALLNLGLNEIVDPRLARPYEPPHRHAPVRHTPSSYGLLMAA